MRRLKDLLGVALSVLLCVAWWLTFSSINRLNGDIVSTPFIEPVIVSKAMPQWHPTVVEEPLITKGVYVAKLVYEEPPFTYDDLYLLAHVIHAESAGEWGTDELMYAVGSVVLNRVASDRFPNTINDVVFQSGQYACTWDGNFYHEPCERAWNIAEDLLINGSTLPEEVVFQALFTQGSGVYCQIQNTYFCY